MLKYQWNEKVLMLKGTTILIGESYINYAFGQNHIKIHCVVAL